MTGQLQDAAWRLPPITERRGGTTPRCMGGCGVATEPGFYSCSVCWAHLPKRLRDGLRRWHSLDGTRRQELVIEVETACAAARRRAR